MGFVGFSSILLPARYQHYNLHFTLVCRYLLLEIVETLNMIQHKHILVNARVTNPISTPNEGIDFLLYLVESINMKVIAGPFANYVMAAGNRGLTAMVMIETSHIAFHIWDETEPGLLQFDLYTCGELNSEVVLAALQKRFDIVSLEYRVYDRANGFIVIERSPVEF